MKYTTMPVCSITYEAVAFISMLAALSTLVERNNYFKPRAIINQPAFPEDTPLPLSVCPTPTRPDGNIYSQLLNSGKASRKQILPNVGGWGGRFPNKVQSKPLKTPPNHSQNRPFLPELHLSFSQKPWGSLLESEEIDQNNTRDRTEHTRN